MTKKDSATIEERENGPLVVKGITSFFGPDGAALESKPVMALCRCGHSSTKPFCDGTHNKVGFESRGGKPAGVDRKITYVGEDVTIVYNPRLCSHAAECGRRAAHIFNPDQKPWIQPDNGSIEEIREVMAACPSGALSLQDEGHLTTEAAEITVEKNGPYRVHGPSIEAGPAGEAATNKKYVLCRCGLSGNKPYCDGSHRDAGWKDGM